MHMDAWVFGQPGAHFDALVGGVVVHHQVQLLGGIGQRDVLEEAQELLMAVTVLADPGDLAGGNLQRGEQGRGAVADIVMGAAFGAARLHRQHRLSAVQGLDLRLLVDGKQRQAFGGEPELVQVASGVLSLGEYAGIEYEALPVNPNYPLPCAAT